jgi:hypothetical protein
LNNKAFKSWVRPDPNCQQCSHIETMECLLCECEYYSEFLWLRLGDVLTQHLNTGADDLVQEYSWGKPNNLQHSTSVDTATHPWQDFSQQLSLLIQEIKRDIIYRWMNLPSSAQQVSAT